MRFALRPCLYSTRFFSSESSPPIPPIPTSFEQPKFPAALSDVFDDKCAQSHSVVDWLQLVNTQALSMWSGMSHLLSRAKQSSGTFAQFESDVKAALSSHEEFITLITRAEQQIVTAGTWCTQRPEELRCKDRNCDTLASNVHVLLDLVDKMGPLEQQIRSYRFMNERVWTRRPSGDFQVRRFREAVTVFFYDTSNAYALEMLSERGDDVLASPDVSGNMKMDAAAMVSSGLCMSAQPQRALDVVQRGLAFGSSQSLTLVRSAALFLLGETAAANNDLKAASNSSEGLELALALTTALEAQGQREAAHIFRLKAAEFVSEGPPSLSELLGRVTLFQQLQDWDRAAAAAVECFSQFNATLKPADTIQMLLCIMQRGKTEDLMFVVDTLQKIINANDTDPSLKLWCKFTLANLWIDVEERKADVTRLFGEVSEAIGHGDQLEVISNAEMTVSILKDALQMAFTASRKAPESRFRDAIMYVTVDDRSHSEELQKYLKRGLERSSITLPLPIDLDPGVHHARVSLLDANDVTNKFSSINFPFLVKEKD